MKKLLSALILVLCAFLTLSLASCGADDSTDSDNGAGNVDNGGNNTDTPDDGDGNTDTDTDTSDDADGTHTHTPGEAVKENFFSGTCEIPSSYDSVVFCTECGAELSRNKITGQTAAHEYIGGKCFDCGAEDPDYEGGGYIGPWDPVDGGVQTPIIPIG